MDFILAMSTPWSRTFQKIVAKTDFREEDEIRPSERKGPFAGLQLDPERVEEIRRRAQEKNSRKGYYSMEKKKQEERHEKEGEKGVAVPYELMNWIENHPRLSDDAKEGGVELIRKRTEFGQKKYGTVLMTGDGRDNTKDSLEELGDLLQYLYKAKLNREDVYIVRVISDILWELLEEFE